MTKKNLSIGALGVMAVSFLLPWISVGTMGMDMGGDLSGLGIVRAMDGIMQLAKMFGQSAPFQLYLVYLLYGIPALALVTIVRIFMDKDTKKLAMITYAYGIVVPLGLLLYVMGSGGSELGVDSLASLSFGFYLTIAAGVAGFIIQSRPDDVVARTEEA